ncbi:MULTISPECIES: TatD family hydrolase [unclassified Agarivorans]|uniref:TatD family hydrolase n=1 Tax=unclassified Agarivorans TaxID=2636026 RepID=UPI0026E2EF1D|nr:MULTISPECIES: TatD family hydrolase [unclassified Agarivorans]MDO6685192.1 TatD family hydrolase [Agarivorans sp. 3_MG-2023]MDO6715636.1 TatD family hydrolase [Agarivorans sp. 2_MG-2023]MDO6763785.1 TatD family hydrolase [Agarivorans sp. 1_MG-2023]
MAWFDTHCHLDFPPFKDDLAAHLARFAQANVSHCMVPAVAPNNWQTVLDLSVIPSLFVALGYHPCFLNEQALTQHPDALLGELNRLQTLVKQAGDKVQAWGECGLDGRFSDTMAHQEFAFDWQIQAAQQQQLPLLIHSVRLHDRVAQLLKQQQFSQGGIIHGFSGSYVQASRFVDLGFKIGVGGTITWPRSEKTRKALKRLPLDALVLETDAPDMPLFEMKQAHNTPLNLSIIFEQLIALRSEPAEQLEQALWDNSLQALHLPM